MTNKESTVFIVDDDQGARESLYALASSMGVKAKAFGSAEEFLSNYDSTQHGCLVTDLRMLGMSGMELQEKLSDDGIAIPVIIITAHAETSLTVRAVKQGAVNVLEKPCRDYELVDAIRDALAQDTKRRLQDVKQKEFRDRFETLSDDERQVLELMTEGAANKVIARRLDVSMRTVENRRQRVFAKTGAGSLAELIWLVVEMRGYSREHAE
jgi:two-component system response regulator FixJ